MSECGTWPIGWPSPVNIETTRLSNGNCRRLGIPKRANYYTTTRVRERLDGICAEAQRSPTEAF